METFLLYGTVQYNKGRGRQLARPSRGLAIPQTAHPEPNDGF